MQMQGLTQKITETLNGLEKSKRVELDIADVQQKLREFQVALDGANIELRHLGNDPQKNEMKQMLRDHKTKLRELRNEFEWKKEAAVKDQLSGDHKGGENDLTTADGLMKHGLDVQKSSTESLVRTMKVVEETRQIGVDTVGKLEKNTEQIEGMYDKLEDIQSTLERSTAIIKRMARKMATDKYIWCIVFLVFAAIMFIIIWQQVQKRKGGSTEGTTEIIPP